MGPDAPDLRDQLQSALGGSYTIERELGGGGMSRVFLARDERLGREVVVKVLAAELAEGLSAERFEREIRVAARLQHPNIVPVLAAGHGAGLPYYTMPFVRGESLRARLTGGTMTPRSAMRLLSHVAHALAYAHAEGVIHRDIKPENVLVANGIAVVTDFGIGKAIDAARSRHLGATLTLLGMALGTPAYMAPEQAAGDPGTDLRADLYAWAVVAYECLAGAHPFAGRRTSQAYITAHMVERPAPLCERSPSVNTAVAALIMKCLEKNREERPTSARTIVETLEVALMASDGALEIRSSGEASLPSVPSRDGPSIAVLPFVNLSTDQENEYFSDGITEEIRNLLAQDRALRVAARSSSFAFKGTATDSRVIAEQLHVRTVLEGSVRRAGNRVRITAQLVNAADGFQLWSDRFDRELTDIFAVQDEIGNAIAETLRCALRETSGSQASADTAVAAATRTTLRTRQRANVEAYDEYLKGRYLNHRRGEGNRAAIAHFQQALALDPDFAPALAGLAESYLWLGIFFALTPTEAFTRTRRYAQAALDLDPNVADAHYLLGETAFWHEWDADTCERHLRRALALEPNSAEALMLSARLHQVRNRDDEALECADAALRADPIAVGTRWYAIVIAYVAGRYARVIKEADRLLAEQPDYIDVLRWRGMARCMTGDFDGALTDLENAAADVMNPQPWLLVQTAFVLCRKGRREDARRLRDQLVERSTRGWIPPIAIGTIEAALGNYDEAFQWFERAYQTRDYLLVMLHGMSELRSVPEGQSHPITDDPRWVALIRRVGMAPSMPPNEG